MQIPFDDFIISRDIPVARCPLYVNPLLLDVINI